MSASPIIRSDDLRAENRYRILGTLRREGPLPRAVLGERTGLSQAAISTLIAQLANERVLATDTGRAPDAPSGAAVSTRRGRPQTQVALASDAASALTISLTIDRLRSALVDYAGAETHVREQRLDTRALDAKALLRAVGAGVARLARHVPDGRIAHIGVAVQGVTGKATGELLWSPITPARAVPLGAVLEKRFGAPTRVNNDCALIARALHQRHADSLGPNFATVLFSHGVGLGLTLDGRSFAGVRSSALEIGHLRFERDGALCRCGRRGCIEAYAADYGIVRLAGNGPLDAQPPGRVDPARFTALVEAATAGERVAAEAFATAGTAVGEGLAGLFTLLDPMPIALVGRSGAAFALMADSLRASIGVAPFYAAGSTAGAVCTDAGTSAETESESAAPLHWFAEDDPLLYAGLALDTLDAMDRRIAGTPTASARQPGARRRAVRL